MSPWSAFYEEVCDLSPDKDHAPLANLLRSIEYNDDEIALALRDDILWTITQTDAPVEVRLAMIDRLITKFVRH